MYICYIVRCADGTYYTGITTDLPRRIEEHNTSTRGAKYTRAKRPVVVVFHRRFRTRSKASMVEADIKKLSRVEKRRLIEGA